MRIADTSRILHDLIFKDTSQSLCARAWNHQDHWFWSAWVWVFGKRHCKASALFYARKNR